MFNLNTQMINNIIYIFLAWSFLKFNIWLQVQKVKDFCNMENLFFLMKTLSIYDLHL